MIIKKLELQGFKSFPDRTKIVFHPGITAIVGPNGTGKSNLVDAILWILGGLRVKSLRGGRTEDVIFNGNAKKPPLNMSDAVLSLASEEEEIVVSHRVFRTGESEYRMNGKAVRLKDIFDELWKHSIGEMEYFVIEQGAIGDFVTSKPADKRTRIEEAAGTAYYKDKKRQAQLKLENTEQNLTRLEDIIAEVERERNSLQRQAQAANRYRRLRERIRELTSRHYQRRLFTLEQSMKDTASEYDARHAKEKDIAGRIRSEENELAASRRKLWDLETFIKQNQEILYGLKSQITRLESDAERESKRIEFFEEKKERAEADRNELLEEVLQLTKDIEENKSRLNEFKKDIEKNRTEVLQADDGLRTAKETAAQEDKNVEELREEYLLALQGITESKNEKVKVEKEIELLLRQEEKLTSQNAENTGFLETNAAAIENIEKAIADHAALTKTGAQKIEGLGRTLDETRKAAAELQSQLDALKARKDETAYHLQALRKIVEKERSEAGSSEIPGALGLLADLIETNPEDAPLFDTFWKEESRSRVIPAEEFLTNVPEKLQGNYLLVPPRQYPGIPEEILRSSGFIGLLKGRVKAQEKIKDALARFEDAVIVKDIAEAIRLWLQFPGIHFLTAAGDLLLSSGLLKAGRKTEGMIALTAEIRKLEDELSRIEAEISPLGLKYGERVKEEETLENAIESEKETVDREARALEDKQKELRFIETEKSKIQTTLNILHREEEILRGERIRLTAQLSDLDKKISDQEADVGAVKAKIEEKEKSVNETQSKTTDLERQYFEKKSGLDLLQEKISSLDHRIMATEKRKQAAETKINLLEEEARTSEEDKGKLRETISELREKIQTLEEEQSAIATKLESSEENLRQVRTNMEEIEQKVQKSREEEEAVKDERITYEVRKAEIDRDLINLEETCWQELKKTLAELREEAEAPPQAPDDQEDIADEEQAEEDSPRSTRRGRKWRSVLDMADEEVETELEEIRENLNSYKAVNLMAEEEFLEKKKRHDFLIQQRQDLRDSIRSTEEAIHKIDEESKVQFLKAITEVNVNFQEVFSSLFKGGTAEVKLLEPDNPLESGVEIVAQPPGKRVQNLSLLSGGEKSLTSLAFLFALFRYKPSPFCFLDEVDAALDDVNLKRFLDLLASIKHQTQFILITHNYKTMEVADYIYGTTMEEPNITKLYSVKLEKKENGSVN